MENGNRQQLLLSPVEEEQNQLLESVPRPTSATFTFAKEADDIPPITGLSDFFREFYKESKKLWYLAAPAILLTIFQYSLGAIPQVFAGHVSAIALAALSIENSVIGGFTFGIMMGMGSALETLCGQAYGAGQIDMLGIYMQRSWVILNSTGLILMFVYIFSQQLLRLIGQSPEISKTAGTFAIWMIPQIFSYAVNYPIMKFLQAQSKMVVITWISAAALVLNVFFCWLLMLKLGWGLVGAAVVLNGSWLFIDIAQLLYIFNGSCGRAWNGFSWKAFQNLWGFVKLSISSALMICLETWYFSALILFAGYLKNAEVSVDALSICVNISYWVIMVAFGFNAAISVRISNELGAAHPRTAKFSLVVASASSFVVGLIIALILIFTRDKYPTLFSSDAEVINLVKELTPLLAFCVVINNVQPVLSGLAIGAGWQAAVAYVNIGCYYIFGVPLGLILGYKVDLGVKGIWCGMLSGTVLQTLFLLGMIYKTNWEEEASVAEDRIKKWGGHSEDDTERYKREL